MQNTGTIWVGYGLSDNGRSQESVLLIRHLLLLRMHESIDLRSGRIVELSLLREDSVELLVGRVRDWRNIVPLGEGLVLHMLLLYHSNLALILEPTSVYWHSSNIPHLNLSLRCRRRRIKCALLGLREIIAQRGDREFTASRNFLLL